MSRGWRLELIEVPAVKRSKGADLDRCIAQEGQRLLRAIPRRCRVVALERTGTLLDTRALAASLQDHAERAENLALLVGGADGLAAECLSRAEQRWSLSPLTLAHPVVRVVVAEQIYRAWSVLHGHPYHRES